MGLRIEYCLSFSEIVENSRQGLEEYLLSLTFMNVLSCFQYRLLASVFALGILEMIVEEANLEKSVIYLYIGGKMVRYEIPFCLPSVILHFIKERG